MDRSPFRSFLIGRTESGEPIEHSCDPGTFAESAPIGRAAPSGESFVFFHHDVLLRYEAAVQWDWDREYLTLEGGFVLLATGGRVPFVVRYEGDEKLAAAMAAGEDTDIHFEELSIGDPYIVVTLGEIGRMPLAEQDHWRQFNRLPDDSPSLAALQRNAVSLLHGSSGSPPGRRRRRAASPGADARGDARSDDERDGEPSRRR